MKCRDSAYDTWHSPSGGRTHQLDHIFVRRTDMRSVMDAKAVGWGVDSDHRAIVMRKRIIRTIWRPRAPLVRVDRNKLRDENVAKEFREKVQANRAHLISEYGRALTADEERCALEEAMRATAMDVLKADKGRLRSGWFGAYEARLRSVIDKRDDVQKRYSAMWVPTAEIKAELREARKAVRRVVREAKESWALTLVSEINNRESADDRRPISPKEVWQVIRALQNGPRVVRAVKPLNLRKNQLTGMGEMCETEEENREVMLNAQRKTFEQYPPHSQPAVDKVKQRETQFWMDKLL